MTQVENPIVNTDDDTFKRAIKAKRLTDIDNVELGVGKDSHKYKEFDIGVREARSETQEDFQTRKQKFGLKPIDGLIQELLKSFASEFVILFLGVSTIVGAVITLLNNQAFKDEYHVPWTKCKLDTGELYHPTHSVMSWILQIIFAILVGAVLIKVFSDCGKQIVYYELFTYGALVDFENSKLNYFAMGLGLLTFILCYDLWWIDNDIASSAIKQSMVVSLLAQMKQLYDKHAQLKNRESNILCINKVFESHHSLARHHLQNITVLPFRVVKLVIGKVLTEKKESDKIVNDLVTKMGKTATDQQIFDAFPEDRINLRDNYEFVKGEDDKDVLKFKRLTTRELYIRSMMIMESAEITIDSTKGRCSSNITSEAVEERPSLDAHATYESEETLEKLNVLRDEIPFFDRATCMMISELGHIYEPLIPHFKNAVNYFEIAYLLTAALVAYGLWIVPTLGQGDDLSKQLRAALGQGDDSDDVPLCTNITQS